ncbi:MAG: hypothetical protein KHX35_09990, partial [Sutterella wadsworthensis]|nr:hypothetical protein [Sutterella wadsworthensis]
KEIYRRSKIAELKLGSLSIPTQRFALDGEFRDRLLKNYFYPVHAHPYTVDPDQSFSLKRYSL